MEGWIDWSRTSRSPDYRGSHSFATFMIIGPTCFFLGILFAAFPYDYPLLWSSRPVPADYSDQLETHLRFVYAAPPLIGRMLKMAITVSLAGFLLKLLPRPSQANFLFDGAGLILFIICIGVYRSNIVEGLRAVHDCPWADGADGATGAGTGTGLGADGSGGDGIHGHGQGHGEAVLGREDTFRQLAISNTILALALVGILVLQSGQWYAERKEHDDLEKIAAERRDSRGSFTKRKQ